ncbi:MAG: hypothetical protein QOE06_745 [Thermoleophilaceae bacterium]|jgi:hypothetical protein|nr:hypothetical protein [Thermoleophilaceae bacterium]
MRGLAGYLGFVAAFVAPGLALLYALGLVRRVREVPAALGPAFLAGVAVVMSLLMLALTAGVAVRMPAFAAAAGGLTAALAVSGFVLARRSETGDGEPAPVCAAAPTALEKWLTRAVIGLLAAFFVIGYTAYRKSSTVGDDWAIWSYKGLALFEFGGKLDNGTFTGTVPGPAHLDYPLLLPLFQSLFFRSVGAAQLQQFHSVLWLLFAAFIWTIAWLARARGLPLLALLIPTAALAFTSKSHTLVADGYADVPVAAFAGAGVLAVGLWLQNGGRRYAILGAVLLVAAANTKNEGLMAAAAVLAVAGAVVLIERGREWRTWLMTAAVVAAGVAPWTLWRSSNHIRSQDVAPLGDALGPSHTLDRLDRVPKSFTALLDSLSDGAHWGYIPACLLVLAIACLVWGTARRQAAFYLAVPTVMLLGLVFVYWTGLPPIDYWLENSANRTVAGVVYVCGVGLVHLTALVVGRLGAPGPERAPATGLSGRPGEIPP